MNLAQPYSDAKTIVDKPTSKSSQQVLADFAAFNLSAVTEGDIVNFLDNDFLGEGLELQAATLPGFSASPPFLSNVTDPLLQAFAQIVNGYWTQLARTVNQSALCSIYPGGACESTFIPLNYSFVVPGGRFREQCLGFLDSYLIATDVLFVDYWDSYWIIQGLLESQLYDTVNGTLQNFMDGIQDFGFIPNGGRTYCKYTFPCHTGVRRLTHVDLDRSQPPLFVHVSSEYQVFLG